MIWYGIAGTLTLPPQSARMRRRIVACANPETKSTTARRIRVSLIALVLAATCILSVGVQLVSAAHTGGKPFATQDWSTSSACTLLQLSPRHATVNTLKDYRV
jgi:hypothetical protein